VNDRREIQELVWIVQPKIRERVSDTNARGGVRITLLGGRGCADEIERNTEVDAEMVREVAADGSSDIIDGTIGTGTTFKAQAQGPPRHEASCAATIRSGGSWIGGLRVQNGTKDQEDNGNEPTAREHLG